jgi:gas vesicle protein
MRLSDLENTFSREIESIFKECEKEIVEAVRDYQHDVESAVERLKKDLNNCSSGTVH